MLGYKDTKIIWCGTLYDCGGYAYNNREYITRLHDRGWKLSPQVIRGTKDIGEEEIKFLDSLIYKENGKNALDLDKSAINVVSHLPLRNIPKFRCNIIYTMMETKGVGPGFIDRCNKFYDICWTPTKYNAKVFKEYGLNIPVAISPIGIDEIYDKLMVCKGYKFKWEKFGDGPDEPEGYKFISVFRWSYRKGFDVLLRAYLREFSKKDNVSLLIHSRHAAMSHDPKFNDYVRKDIQRFIDENKDINLPPVYWCNQVVPQQFMPTLYGQGDCYVNCSRGEGFSLPSLEASKIGLPLIAPYHTGFTDYLTDDNSYKFDVDEWIVCNREEEWRRGAWITGEYNGQEFPKFGECKVEEVGKLMREVMENKEEAICKNENMQKLIDNRYSWEKCISSIEENIKVIIDES